MNQASGAPERDIILVGGSAGAIEALQQMLKALPSEFPASLFVVVHTAADGPGLLPRVLACAARRNATHPVHGEPIRSGHIYVAPPDHHLTLGPDDVIHLRRGPRENGVRPAIDPLFRSAAARGYGSRTIAVVLSGYLDDGSAGLFAVRRRAGLAIVQEPTDALVEDMPLHALQYAGADYVLPATEIGAKLVELVRHAGKVVPMKKKKEPGRSGAPAGAVPAENDMPPNSFVAYRDEGEGTPSVFACPECHGVLWEITGGGSVRYRCRTGHAYSGATLDEELSHAAESALWAAMRALEEKAAMSRRMANAAAGPNTWKNRLQEQAQTYAAHAEMLRRMILGEPPATEVRPPAELLDRDQAG